jgi:hypothetical protein
MIYFLLTRGHAYTVKTVRRAKAAPEVRWMFYDDLFRRSRLPQATYIFTDLDRLSYWDLELAGHVYLQLKAAGVKVLNNPARVKKRYALLRCLHDAGINDFAIHRADDLPDILRFPVFLRKAAGHGKPLSDLLQSPTEVRQKIDESVAAGIPVENQVVIEYAGEPVRENLFRKLAVFRIGDVTTPAPCVHETRWLVKSGELGIAGEELYRDDLDIVRTNRFGEELRQSFALAEIEYGRADFGFRRGRIQVFEINTNPDIKEIGPHPSPLREECMRLAAVKYFEALHTIDSPAGPAIELADEKLRKYRKCNWNNLFTRARIVE